MIFLHENYFYMYTIYHNPRCRKSREALTYLEASGVKFEIVLYLKDPLSMAELKEILNKTGLTASQLVRKNEAEWKSQSNRNELTDDDIIEVWVRHPKTLERPIVTTAQSGILARPLENLITFLNAN